MHTESPSKSDILQVAREKLGFDDLRPGQMRAIQSVVEGRDTLVVQPTGSGKSAIYQIAGLMIEGATVVVSPLIALQKDQVDSINRRNAAPAVALNSAAPASATRDAFERMEGGAVEYIFLAPEQLRKSDTVERLSRAGVSLFVVDEAHCVSQWGHNFRPDYLELGRVIETLGHPRVLAMTATAAPQVRDEIVKELRLRDPRILVQGFDRPNIFLRVDHFDKESEKRDALVHRIVWADKPGVVYTGSRKSAEELVHSLSEEGVDAVFYHAGLPGKERESIQERFMSGDVEVIVATNAFGMGVDKPNVRFVFHNDPPESLDAYYQEIGRAGRDGERSDAVLFYRAQNIGAQSFKTGEGHVEPETLEIVANIVSEGPEPVDPAAIAELAGLSERKVLVVARSLENAGAVEILPDGHIAAKDDANLEEAVVAAAAEQDERREGKRERLREMRAYAESSSCRRELLLRHLGDSFEGPCGFCDNCEGPGREVAAAADGTRREVV